MHGCSYIPCNATEYHLLEVAVLPPKDRDRSLCDMGSFLRDGRYQQLDEQLENALAASFLSRESEQRYYLAWINYGQGSDLRDIISADAEGLAYIKAWQRARPASNHAWLAETLYWLYFAWQYRSHGWATETTPSMWACAATCNKMMVLAALKSLTLEPRQWMVAAIVVTAFNVPDWLDLISAGKNKGTQSILNELRSHQQQYPEEMDALMAYSGLNGHIEIIIPDALPAGMQPKHNGRRLKGRNFWLFAALHIHPTLYFIFRDYIPFKMPRWRGSQEEIRQLISSSVCEHLSEQERDHLRHLVWWDDFRDACANEVEDLSEREKQFIEVRREAEQALNAIDRSEALRRLTVSYYELGDEVSAWHCLQQAVAQEPDLGPYLHNVALLLAEKFAPDSRWRHNQICHNAQYAHSSYAMVLLGYCLLTGLFGFTKNESLGRQWLDYALKQKSCFAWSGTADKLRELGYQEEAIHLLTLGAERGATNTASNLAYLYLFDKSIPRDIPRVIAYCRQTIDQNTAILSQRIVHKYPLINNNDSFSYENELKSVYYYLACCYQLLCSKETDAEKIVEFEQQLIISLKAAVDWGDEQSLPMLLALLSEIKTLSVTHQYIDFLLEHSYKGNITAMTSLAKIYFNRRDKKLYNYKESARWMYFAQTIAPDDEKVKEVFFSHHGRSRWSIYRFVWSTLRIAAHEIPGQENSMV